MKEETKTPETVYEAAGKYVDKEGFSDVEDVDYISDAFLSGAEWKSQHSYTQEQMIAFGEAVKERCMSSESFSDIFNIDISKLLKK